MKKTLLCLALTLPALTYAANDNPFSKGHWYLYAGGNHLSTAKTRPHSHGGVTYDHKLSYSTIGRGNFSTDLCYRVGDNQLKCWTGETLTVDVTDGRVTVNEAGNTHTYYTTERLAASSALSGYWKRKDRNGVPFDCGDINAYSVLIPADKPLQTNYENVRGFDEMGSETVFTYTLLQNDAGQLALSSAADYITRNAWYLFDAQGKPIESVESLDDVAELNDAAGEANPRCTLKKKW